MTKGTGQAKLNTTGPNAAEQRFLDEVCDPFYRAVNRRPGDAAKMAYELAVVARKYDPQQKGKSE